MVDGQRQARYFVRVGGGMLPCSDQLRCSDQRGLLKWEEDHQRPTAQKKGIQTRKHLRTKQSLLLFGSKPPWDSELPGH